MEEGKMRQVKVGDTVKVNYTGKLKDGTIFALVEAEPFQFTLGEGEMIPGFENAVIGMSPGESKIVEIPADEAFGTYSEERVFVVDRNRLPKGLNPQVGEAFQIPQAGGPPVLAVVADISELSVTLDANHPLAGEDLIYEIRLLEVL
jgi:peptidylprolyl isomerase